MDLGETVGQVDTLGPAQVTTKSMKNILIAEFGWKPMVKIVELNKDKCVFKLMTISLLCAQTNGLNRCPESNPCASEYNKSTAHFLVYGVYSYCKFINGVSCWYYFTTIIMNFHFQDYYIFVHTWCMWCLNINNKKKYAVQ